MSGPRTARTHHIDDYDDDDEDPTQLDFSAPTKKVKFDVRNPSALAAGERDEDDDAFLDADVIGRSGAAATKRGAVNIDGFDSDSDVDEFNAKAQRRGKKADVNIDEAFAQYGQAGGGAKPAAKAGSKGADEDDDDDMDMFAPGDGVGDKNAAAGDDDDPEFYASGKKKKDVRFLDASNIRGQNLRSKGGRTVRIDRAASGSGSGSEDSDEEDAEDDVEEDDDAWKADVIDEEVGAGGRKKRAPKIDAFNLRGELEEGRFDENQNYVRNAVDPDAVHDKWLDGVSKRAIREAAAAHERREAEAEALRREEDSLVTSDLLAQLIRNLERGETALEALARLGKRQKKEKKLPKWKLKKIGAMDADEDPEQVRISAAIASITDVADKLFSRDRADIYDQERELLMREYKKETGDDWVDPPRETAEGEDAPSAPQMWEYRWTDGRDEAVQGPFDGPTMKAWQDAGYFGEGVEFKLAGDEGGWSRLASFV